MSWVLWVTPIVLLCLGLPIYLCFLAGSIAALLFVTSVPTSIVPQVMFGSVDSFTLLAVPFFLFVPAGVRRALDALNTLLGIVLCLYVVAQALQVVRLLSSTGQRSVIARIPMNVMYTSVLLGFGLAALFPVLAWLRRGDAR